MVKESIYCIRRVWRYQGGNQESVYRRRTDKAMAKRKGPKGQTAIFKTYTYN